MTETLGQWLRALREAQGLSIAKFAKRLRVCDKTVSHRESRHGRQRLSVRAAQEIEEAFGVEVPKRFVKPAKPEPGPAGLWLSQQMEHQGMNTDDLAKRLRYTRQAIAPMLKRDTFHDKLAYRLSRVLNTRVPEDLIRK